MSATWHRDHLLAVDHDGGVAVAVPAPVRRRPDRIHDAPLEHRRQRLLEDLQQRIAQPVHAHVVVFVERARLLERAPRALGRLGHGQPDHTIVVDAILLAEHRAVPFAGLGQEMSPGDVAVLLALEAVIEGVVSGLVVEAPDQPVAQRQPGQQGEIALGHAEGHVGPRHLAPFGQHFAAAIDDAGVAAARRHRPQHLVVGRLLAGVVGHHELAVGHAHAGGPFGLGGLGEGDGFFQIIHARNQHWRLPASKRRNAGMAMPSTLTLRRPDDWHAHLRDGPMLEAVAIHTARQFARAIIMPNLVPPVTTVDQGAAYRERIRRAIPAGLAFEPLMTCYLTDDAAPVELVRGKRDGVWIAAKLYPAHATTNSAHGVTSMDRIAPALEAMEKEDMPLLVHGEVTDAEVDIFDREAVFLDKVLAPLLRRYQGLKVVLEHVTTREGVAFVGAGGARVGGTIARHHLSYNRNAIFKGGIRPHLYCLPIAKSEEHRLALRRAATSGSAQFFLGTDTEPHTADTKECACGCAGIFNAPVAMQVYSQVFAEEGALDRLEAFASLNGPRFYGLLPNEERITLRAKLLEAPERIEVPGGDKSVVVFHPDTPVNWSF